MTAPALTSPQRRPWYFVRNRRKLVCSVGHHIADEFRTNESVAVRCKHRYTKQSDCGRWMFLIALPGTGGIVAEVTLDEIDEMNDLADATAVLDYLGIMPGPL